MNLTQEYQNLLEELKTKSMVSNLGSTQLSINKIERLPMPQDLEKKINDIVSLVNQLIDITENYQKRLSEVERVINKLANCEAVKAMVGLSEKAKEDSKEQATLLKVQDNYSKVL